ncbi:hypothetical protein [Mycobacterium sp. DL440]|uniref:hypothetical protein n=1 Tax=Mycobacterium sp. DL440 TaxID=2675523 RepID=UPI001AB006A3|nr:hypothetical protein [Mycobacterium sp. DL440]
MRSTLTAGIALAGAGAIAVGPISPVTSPLPDATVATPHVSSASVQLTALADELENPFAVDPITAWMNVFEPAFENVAQIGGEMAANPFPILQQVIANQMANGQLLATSLDAAAMSYIQFFTSAEDYRLKFFVNQAVDYLAAGNVAGAASVLSNVVFRLFAFANPLINTMQIPLGMGRNLLNALSAVPDLLMPLGLGVLNPVESVINVLGDSAQNILDAAEAGDPAAALNALVNTPAVLTGAVLNGYYNGIAAGTSGLLTAADAVFNRGLVQSLLVTLPQTIATAIGWQKPSVPEVPATTEVDEPTTPTDVTADVAADTPMVNGKALAATRELGDPAADLTRAVGRIADSTAAAVKTVTLSVTPQRPVVDTPAAGTPAGTEAEAEPADTSAASDTSGTKNTRTERNTSRSAKRVVGTVKNVAKAQRDTAKHGTKARSGGAKHRAGGDHSK